MKHFISSIVLALCALISSQAANYKSIVIEMTDNSSVGVNISDDLITTFVDKEIRFKKGFKTVLTLERAKVASFNFSETVSLAEPTVDSAEGLLNFSNLPQGAVVTVTDMAGCVVLTAPSADGHCTVSLAGLPHGAYIVNAGSITLKIAE